MKNSYEQMTHEFEPICDNNSKILILGTFPSVKSREASFYYGHPRNRFWKVISALTAFPEPLTIEEKEQMLLDSGIAVWDVIKSCDIIGSSDSSIKNVVPADIAGLLKKYEIQQIFTNGGKASQLYHKYIWKETNREPIGLPSTSPANASYTLDRLLDEWSVIKGYLK